MSETLAIPADKQDEILKYLGLSPSDTATQALVQICNRYGFDPLLKHVVLIGGKGQGKNTYVTRDGLLHLAHQSHQLDGIQVMEEGENDKEWWAVVQVHRKDMKYPFRYKGRYAKSSMNKAYGPEMAVKCAEVMALRRAFDVSLPTVEEQWDTVSGQVGSVEPLQEHHVPDAKEVETGYNPPPPPPSPKESIAKARESLQALPVVTEIPRGPMLRGEIRSLMNQTGVSREHREAFRAVFGPVDEISDKNLEAARDWCLKKVSELGVEPF